MIHIPFEKQDQLGRFANLIQFSQRGTQSSAVPLRWIGRDSALMMTRQYTGSEIDTELDAEIVMALIASDCVQIIGAPVPEEIAAFLTENSSIWVRQALMDFCLNIPPSSPHARLITMALRHTEKLAG